MNSYYLQIICLVASSREWMEKGNPMNKKMHSQTISEATKGEILQYSTKDAYLFMHYSFPNFCWHNENIR